MPTKKIQTLNNISTDHESQHQLVLMARCVTSSLVTGSKSHEVRKRLLCVKALTLNTALDIIRAAEITKDQLKKIDGEVETPVNALKSEGKKSDDKQGVDVVNQCNYCGTTHNVRQCPAHGKKSNKCNMKNHFAEVCITATSKARNQESQSKKETPVKGMSK